jgi:hypothetical protein
VRVYDSDKNEWEMGSEDLDTWDATLQVCLARVLDHLAGTIASTHTPTGASATRAAELMLSHLVKPALPAGAARPCRVAKSRQYMFCQYISPELAHDGGPCDCFAF